MKQQLLILLSLFLISSCSSVKRSQQALNEGNYNEAMTIAIGKLQKDKTQKSNQEHILILESAFKKITEANKKRITFLKKEGNPANAAEIYKLYQNLDYIQERIRPLLPLYIEKAKREAKFSFNNYTDELIHAKEAYADFLYNQAVSLMNKDDKYSYRNAYARLSELQRLSPGYKDTDNLLEEAHYKGTDFVLVGLRNQTPYVIPKRLEEELLSFNTYGLDDLWTEYHATQTNNSNYDFEVNLNFREIQISPERILEREIPMEAEILDGYSYKKDRRGDFVLDSLGNKIKIEHYITAKGTLYKTIQSKSLVLQGKVDYLDLHKEQLLNSYPLETEFVFENVFARFKGDERLLTKEDKQLLNNHSVAFPTNEQLLLDASADIKSQLAPILKQNHFR